MKPFQAPPQLRNFVLLFCFAFFIVACDKGDEANQKPASVSIPQLNDSNVKTFARTLAKDYFTLEGSLISTFSAHKKAGDAFGFTQFRNQQWTPAYIEKKNYYQAVLKQNNAYLTDHSIAPVFSAFENLIYTGINLKNALLKDDQALEDETLSSLEQDKKTVKNIIKSIK